MQRAGSSVGTGGLLPTTGHPTSLPKDIVDTANYTFARKILSKKSLISPQDIQIFLDF